GRVARRGGAASCRSRGIAASSGRAPELGRPALQQALQANLPTIAGVLIVELMAFALEVQLRPRAVDHQPPEIHTRASKPAVAGFNDQAMTKVALAKRFTIARGLRIVAEISQMDRPIADRFPKKHGQERLFVR